MPRKSKSRSRPRRAGRSRSPRQARSKSPSRSPSRRGQKRAAGLSRGKVSKTEPRTARERKIRRSLERSHSRQEGRGSLTRGWSIDKPSRVSERRALADKCDNLSECFLDPVNLKYVVCARNSCKPDPRGTMEAYMRARQHGREDLANKAIRLGKKYNHAWALKH